MWIMIIFTVSKAFGRKFYVPQIRTDEWFKHDCVCVCTCDFCLKIFIYKNVMQLLHTGSVAKKNSFIRLPQLIMILFLAAAATLHFICCLMWCDVSVCVCVLSIVWALNLFRQKNIKHIYKVNVAIGPILKHMFRKYCVLKVLEISMTLFYNFYCGLVEEIAANLVLSFNYCLSLWIIDCL